MPPPKLVAPIVLAVDCPRLLKVAVKPGLEDLSTPSMYSLAPPEPIVATT